MDVPILDDEWMRDRQRRLYWQEMLESRPLFMSADTVEKLREEYALGRISFEEFERRVEKVLR